MTIQQTSGSLTNSVRTAYGNRYIEAAKLARVYDQLAVPIGAIANVEKAAQLDSTVQVPFLGDMRVTETSISQVADLNPQVIRDASTTVTPVSRMDGMQVSELMNLEAFTDYSAQQFEKIGKNMMETVDLLAQAAALKGGNLIRVTTRRGSTNNYGGDGGIVGIERCDVACNGLSPVACGIHLLSSRLEDHTVGRSPLGHTLDWYR